MALIDETIQPQQQTSQLSVADHQELLKAFCKTGSLELGRNINTFIRELMKRIWQNQNLTPQEAFDAFGTDAVSLFLLAGKAGELLTLLDPTYQLPLPPMDSTKNADGTVTVL